MDADTVVAASATIVAVAALAVSSYQAWATRRHNRLSVRPLLELRVGFRPGGTAGLRLVNAGLGPAVVTGSLLTLDGVPVGVFDEANVNAVREGLETVWPSAVTFGGRSILPADYEGFLLGVDDYDADRHAELYHLLRCRLGLELRYESLYGGERYTATWTPRTDDPRCRPGAG